MSFCVEPTFMCQKCVTQFAGLILCRRVSGGETGGGGVCSGEYT